MDREGLLFENTKQDHEKAKRNKEKGSTVAALGEKRKLNGTP